MPSPGEVEREQAREALERIIRQQRDNPAVFIDWIHSQEQPPPVRVPEPPRGAVVEPDHFWEDDEQMLVKKMPKREKHYNIPLLDYKGLTKYTGPLLGIEIECEGKSLFDTPLSYWAAKQDGSLHPKSGSTSIEYVLTKPLDRKEVEKALRYLEKKLQEVKASLDDSPRTSVHVHLNVSDLTIRQIYCIILLWIIFEDILIEWCGPERKGNLFCLSAKDSEFFPRMLTTALEKGSYRDVFREDYRYLACNVASLFKFGSLEFRPMRGTADRETILTWIDMLLVIYNKALTYDNPPEFIHQFLSDGPITFFNRIFDDPKLNRLLRDTPDLHSRLWSSMRIARDVAFVCRWDKPLPLDLVKKEEKKKIRYRQGDEVISVYDGRRYQVDELPARRNDRNFSGPGLDDGWVQPAFNKALIISFPNGMFELVELIPVNPEEVRQ